MYAMRQAQVCHEQLSTYSISCMQGWVGIPPSEAGPGLAAEAKPFCVTPCLEGCIVICIRLDLAQDGFGLISNIK